MTQTHVPPTYGSDGFNCPYCGAYAHQNWFPVTYMGIGLYIESTAVYVTKCQKCQLFTLWLNESVLYPASSIAPLASADMPLDVKEDFNEARNIVVASPRGATGLLRLALQKLIIHLGEKGENINDDIKSLVAKGLPAKIQQALDTVRVVGNNAVHPGQMDLKDDVPTALALFGLLNLIVDTMITQPKKIAEMYNNLPMGSLDAIKKRDGVS